MAVVIRLKRTGRRNRACYRISVAAKAAKLSPNTLRRRMRDAGLPVASDLTDAQVKAAAKETGGDVASMARLLRVSVHGMRLRWAELG